MKWIINYFRECFCKHEWELLREIVFYEYRTNIPIGHKWAYKCKKCGRFIVNKDYEDGLFDD